MQGDTHTYGGLGVALLRVLSERGQGTFTIADAREAAAEIGGAPSYTTLLLHRLASAGLIKRIKRGTYALTTGLSGFPQTHPFAIGMALLEPCAVSGWSALNHHGLTEQIPQRVTLTTPRRVVTPAMRGVVKTAPSIWLAAGTIYEIVTVVPAHYFGFEEIWQGEARVRIFDRERALLDCFALPRRFGGLNEGLGILDEHLHEIDLKRLVDHALAYGKASVAKRLGFALESAGVDPSLFEPLRRMPITGVRLLDSTKPSHGDRVERWGLLNNLGRKTT